MSDYTPTTEYVRDFYAKFQPSILLDKGPNGYEHASAEFDHWLAQERNAAVHDFIREASRHVEDHISITALWHLAPGGKSDA